MGEIVAAGLGGRKAAVVGGKVAVVGGKETAGAGGKTTPGGGGMLAIVEEKVAAAVGGRVACTEGGTARGTVGEAPGVGKEGRTALPAAKDPETWNRFFFTAPGLMSGLVPVAGAAGAGGIPKRAAPEKVTPPVGVAAVAAVAAGRLSQSKTEINKR